MKRFFLIAIATLLAAISVSAQDMATATETYNNGAMALQMGDNAGALSAFQQALSIAEACGEEGADIVNNCKDIIPKLVFAIGKEYAQNKEYDKAIPQIQEAIKVATEYGNDEVAEDAAALIPQLLLQKANGLLRDKNFAEAVQAYKDVIAVDPDNGRTYFSLGQALLQTGARKEAEETLLKAAEMGQQKDAYKLLSNTYVKDAAANLKAKKYQEAINAALKSNEYLENATAYKVAGTAASQLKQNADAVNYLEKYLEMSPNAKDANQMCYTIAALSQQLGDKEKAKAYYQKIVADPKFGETAKQQLQSL
ncbi:MAG: tetratricopeptide repeat protein [Bacteroidales bacterium]|nr:tetratricopeptide repeat protein [Bacteroidales bacterium]